MKDYSLVGYLLSCSDVGTQPVKILQTRKSRGKMSSMIPKKVICSTKPHFILAGETSDRGKPKGTLLLPELHITNGT